MPLRARRREEFARITVIDTVEAAERLGDELRRLSTPTAFDTETIGCNPKRESPVGRARCICGAICYDLDEVFYIKNYAEAEGTIKGLKAWFEDPAAPKVAHNSKYDMHVIQNHGIRVRGMRFDTTTGAWLCDENQFKALDKQVPLRFGREASSFSETFRYRPLTKNLARRHTKSTNPRGLDEIINPGSQRYQPGKLKWYACKDPWDTLCLYESIIKELGNKPWHHDKSVLDYYYEFELPFLDVLFEMEQTGTHLDLELLGVLGEDFRERADRLEGEICDALIEDGLAPERLKGFNVNSNDQLSKILFDDIGYEAGIKTAKGRPSVKDEELKRLSAVGCKAASKVLERRALTKLIGTYVEALEAASRRGKVHTGFDQTGAVTGRLSSNAPNLQNIPARTEDGKQIREAFIASPHHRLVVADYAQIELKILAHFSRDEAMLEGFRSGVDFHALTAQRMFGLNHMSLEDIAEQYSEERARSKSLNFGIIYGQGPGSMAQQWGVEMDEAVRLLDLHKVSYPGVHAFRRYVIEMGRRTGSVRTLLRRYRHLPDLVSNDRVRRGISERMAVNAVIQGSAADLVKMAMILIHRDERLKELGCKMMLQVHDELVLDTPEDTAEEAADIVADYMRIPYKSFGVRPLLLPTNADVKIVCNWKDGK